MWTGVVAKVFMEEVGLEWSLEVYGKLTRPMNGRSEGIPGEKIGDMISSKRYVFDM